MSKKVMAFVGTGKDDRLLAADSFSGSCGWGSINTNEKSEKKGINGTIAKLQFHK